MHRELPEVPGYRLLEPIGSGASGAVYRARQLSLDREVALKLLSAGMFDEAEMRARFVREAKLQSQLAHPNLVDVYDAGFAGARPYLALALVDGGTLRRRLQTQGRLSIAEALRLASEVAAGLSVAHAAGIVHRDLKPENVLLTAAGAAKVSDFGLAKGVALDSSFTTRDQVILGTPGYLAPEILRGSAATPASDVFALGLVLFEMLTGEPLYAGQSMTERLEAQIQGSQASLDAALRTLHASIGIVLRACLAQSPADRPSDAAQAHGLIAGVLALLAASHASEPTVLSAGRSPRATPIGARAPDGALPEQTELREFGTGSPPPLPRTRPAPVPPIRKVEARARRPGAAVAAGIAAVAALLLAAAVRREPVIVRTPFPAAARTSVSGPAIEGEIAFSVASGSHRIRVTFDRPLAASGRFDMTARAGVWRVSGPLAAGTQTHGIPGLVPATAYRLTVTSGTRERALDVETLPVAGNGRDLVLAGSAPALARPRLSVTSETVLAVWHEEDRAGSVLRGLMRVSHDGGETWLPAETVDACRGALSVGTIVQYGTEVTAALASRAPTPPAAEVWHRSDGRWSRIPLDSLGIGWQPYAQAVRSGATLNLLLHDGPRLALARFDCVNATLHRQDLPPWSGPPLELLRSWRLSTDSVGLLGATTGEIWLARAAPGQRAWTLRRQSIASESSAPALGSVGNRFVAAYATQEENFLKLWTLREGDAHSVEPAKLHIEVNRAVMLEMMPLGDSLYLIGVFRSMFGLVQPLMALQSADGASWAVVARQSIPMSVYRAMSFAPSGRGHALGLLKSDGEGVLLRRIDLTGATPGGR